MRAMNRYALILLSSLAASACGGSSTPASSPSGSSGGEAVVDPLAGRLPPAPSDLSPAAVPRDLVLTIRTGPIDPTLESARRLMHIQDASTSDVDFRGWLGSAELAGAIDRSRGLDAALILVDGDPRLVMAFDAASMRDVVAAIPVSVSQEPLSDGSLLVHPSPGAEDARECAVQPSAQGGRVRIVCAEGIAELEQARAYLARNLTSPVEAGVLHVEVAVEALRARYASDLRGGLMIAGAITGTLLVRASTDDTVPAEIRALLSDETVRAKLEVLARDAIDDANSFLGEVRSITADLRIEGDAVHVSADLRVPAASGSMLRALARSARGTDAAPEELLARLPPGAVAYATGDWEGESLDTITTEFRDLLVAIVASDTRVSAADRDAFERTLAVMIRPQTYQYAVASGSDPTATSQWSVVAARYAGEGDARAAVDAARQYVAVLRRPSIARAFDRFFESLGPDRPRFSQVAEIRANGLPQGSYAARFPAFERFFVQILSRALGVTLPTPDSPAVRSMVLIPNGRDLLVVSATDAVAVYRGLASAGGLPSEIRTPLLQPGWSMNLALRLGNLRIPGPTHPENGAQTFESIIGAEAGQAVILARFRDSGASDDVHFEAAFDIPGALFRGLPGH